VKNERLYKVILSPHISEKATVVGEKHNQVVFKVVPDATKPEIKNAVEMLFDVKVDSVRVVNSKPKKRSHGRISGKTKAWRKAYVSLKEGFDIDFLGVEGA